MSEKMEGIFERDSLDEHVWTVHGFGIQILMQSGHLEVRDGIGKHRRIRRIPRVDRTLRRIVISGSDGYISLAAMRWCAQHGISIVTINPNDELVASWSPADRDFDVQLVRKQVMSSGLEEARYLLRLKVQGQAEIALKFAGDLSVYSTLERFSEEMKHAQTVQKLNEIEGWAAKHYFKLWTETVQIHWSEQDVKVIPSNWLRYPGRSSVISGGGKKYNAADPINAMLNFAYTLGYSEARAACIGVGLDPRLGVSHSDKPGRDSLALDVLEAIRPEIDRCILELISSRQFNRKDFTEPAGFPPGSCRIVAPLTHEIAEQSWSWSKSAEEAARTVMNILTGHDGRRGDTTNNLIAQKLEFQSVTVTAQEALTDQEWQELEPLVPVRPPNRVGHVPVASRTVIAAMVHMERHHRPWGHLPPSFGLSYRTMTDRRREWQRSGHWPAIWQAIQIMANRPQ